MRFYFCTYFDSNYLIKGLTLYRSLLQQSIPFRLWVLCLDDLAYKTLQKLNLREIIPIRLRDFEAGDEELLQAKCNRSLIEYYFTCTPSLPLYVLKNNPDVDIVSYLDADLFFFSNPSAIYEELGDKSVLIIGHRFPSRLKHKEVYGIFNVGFLSFRNDSMGLQCLHWWRDRCLEWCYDRVEDGRFADQRYLDEWPTRFQKVAVLQHKGAGLALWNIENYTSRVKNSQVTVDTQPLIFFHFHGFKKVKRWLYDSGLVIYGVCIDPLIRRHIYEPYIRELLKTNRWVFRLIGASNISMGSIRGINHTESVNESIIRTVMGEVKYHFPLTRKILQGDLWLVIAGVVLNK